MVFVRGWTELGLIWCSQILNFAEAGWHCVAPDMRGYGGSSVPDTIAAYAVRELVVDMLELHNALDEKPAIWVGHDWRSAITWAMASHRVSLHRFRRR
ncbi:MAG: alpha/beta fold hydrolase [Janthinobacterium lividum]